MSKEHNLLKPFEKDVLGRESYEFFKKNKKFNSIQTDDYYKWKRILTSFLMYFKQMLIFSNKGFYIRDVGYFYFEPVGERHVRVMRFKKVKLSTRYKLVFIPDVKSLSKWQPEDFYINTNDIKICDLEAVEFLKSQNLNGIHLNKRAFSRGRK